MEGLSHTLIAWGSYCHDPQRLSALSIANIKKKKILVGMKGLEVISWAACVHPEEEQGHVQNSCHY